MEGFKKKGEYLVKELRKLGFMCNDIEGGMFVMANVRKALGVGGKEFSDYLLK